MALLIQVRLVRTGSGASSLEWQRRELPFEAERPLHHRCREFELVFEQLLHLYGDEWWLTAI
jgi:hypothetical protein